MMMYIDPITCIFGGVLLLSVATVENFINACCLDSDV